MNISSVSNRIQPSFNGRLHVNVNDKTISNEYWEKCFYENLPFLENKIDYFTPKNSDFYIKANDDGLSFTYVTGKHNIIRTSPLKPRMKQPLLDMNYAIMSVINAGNNLDSMLHPNRGTNSK